MQGPLANIPLCCPPEKLRLFKGVIRHLGSSVLPLVVSLVNGMLVFLSVRSYQLAINQSLAPINSTDKPLSVSPFLHLVMGDYFFLLPIFFSVKGQSHLKVKKREPSQVSSFNECQRQLMLGECRPQPLGNH